MGQHFLQHLRAFLGEDLPPFVWPNLVELTSQQSTRVGLGFVPALAHAAYEGVSRVVTTPLVGDPSYVADLLAADPDELAVMPSEAQPLLQVLLRHGLLREYAEAGARVLDATNPALLRDAELVDLVPGTSPTPTWSWTRGQQSTGGTVADLAEDDARLAEMKAGHAGAGRRRRSHPRAARRADPGRRVDTGSTPGSPRSPPGGWRRCAPTDRRDCGSAATAGWRTSAPRRPVRP